jgi:peptidoglycan/LPS O-acetylase OafA/YrhL
VAVQHRRKPVFSAISIAVSIAMWVALRDNMTDQGYELAEIARVPVSILMIGIGVLIQIAVAWAASRRGDRRAKLVAIAGVACWVVTVVVMAVDRYKPLSRP